MSKKRKAAKPATHQGARRQEREEKPDADHLVDDDALVVLDAEIGRNLPRCPGARDEEGDQGRITHAAVVMAGESTMKESAPASEP